MVQLEIVVAILRAIHTVGYAYAKFASIAQW